MTWLIAVLLATTYATPGDRWDNGQLACPRVTRAQIEHGVAHRSLPCGTRLLLCSGRTWRCVAAWVVDRGPYGAICGGRWRVMRRLRPGCKWRGDLDLRPGTASALGHNGKETVVVAMRRR